MTKFKVGDTVKVINNGIFNPDLKIGDVGDITNVNESEIIINFHKEGCEEQTCNLVYASEYIEPIKKDLASEDLEDRVEKKYKQYLKDMENRKIPNGYKLAVVDDIVWTIDKQIEYHEKKLAELKAQKEKEKWQFTEDEKIILKNIPEGYNWLYRDDTNCLYISNCEPYRKNNFWIYEGRFFNLKIFNDLFQSISSEDTEPCEFRKYI